MRYTVVALAVLLIFVGGPLLSGYPQTATGRGIIAILATRVGYAFAALAIGSVGFLNREHRYATFVICTAFATMAILLAGPNG